MKTQEHPNDKLRKSSIIFLQLGLILSMLFVYSILESKFTQKELVDFTPKEMEGETTFYPPTVILPEPKKKITEKVKPKKKKASLEKLRKTKDKDPIIETVLDPTPDTYKDEITKAIGILPDITDEPDDEPVIFTLLEEAPVYPGCEGLSDKENKICFTKKIKKFVNKKFNTDLAEELSLHGKQKIYVQFVIDKDGTVSDIKTSAHHKRLEKETIRIIKKLPKMIPGMQRKRPVPVKYTLPISFEVY